MHLRPLRPGKPDTIMNQSDSMQERRASETPEAREARCHQESVRQQERRASEISEAREVRHHRMSVQQQERRASETPEVTESRLQWDRERHQVHRNQPLLHQAAVKERMQKFHSHLYSILGYSQVYYKFPGNMA